MTGTYPACNFLIKGRDGVPVSRGRKNAGINKYQQDYSGKNTINEYVGLPVSD
jgi:hypothetical protein